MKLINDNINIYAPSLRYKYWRWEAWVGDEVQKGKANSEPEAYRLANDVIKHFKNRNQ